VHRALLHSINAFIDWLETGSYPVVENGKSSNGGITIDAIYQEIRQKFIAWKTDRKLELAKSGNASATSKLLQQSFTQNLY